jgi:phosphomethylpyrimidine synthase
LDRKTLAATAAANGSRNVSQMHYARQGVVTEEMAFVAGCEKIEPELVRSEIARGRAIIPASVHHKSLEPMGIGIAFKCKINSNIGNSATTSNIDEELKKRHHTVHYGADTVMDLSPRSMERISRSASRNSWSGWQRSIVSSGRAALVET